MKIFISDLHLFSNKENNFLLFKKFVTNLPKETKELYILGDLFNLWLGKKQAFLDEDIKPIIKTLVVLSKKTNLFIMRGNKDLLLNGSLPLKYKFIPDEYTINNNSSKILLMHGDTLCTDDKEHIRYRIILDFIFCKLGLIKIVSYKFISNIAKNLKNKAKNTNKSYKVMDVVQQDVEKVMKKHDVNILIHGHTHRPKVHTFGNKTRIVLGDWDTGKTKYLVLENNNYELKEISL